ncbi:MAG TPA: TAXI family TRAP transporter solute-binding subunit [Burkholderiales bacterium]|nr:TAXI family TRAP transporter solute-binding subunit [Burkholderiales bacterium]
MAQRDYTLLFRRYVLVSVIIALALTAAAMWLAFSLFNPTPPRTVSMAVNQGGTSEPVAKRYREILARDRIELRLVPSRGAVESIARMGEPKSGIDVAIIPSGITNQRQSPELVSLGTIGYQALWLFYRSGDVARKDRARETFAGKRVSIGPEGSADHALSLEFFARVGVVNQRETNLLALGPQDAVEKLLHGDIDAAVLLDSFESPSVRQLLSAEGIVLANIVRADAFVALYPYLSKVVLPAGVGDMVNNRPPTDVNLVAPKASLIVRRDLHPAIQYLLLQAATEIHSGPGVFRRAGQFPAPESLDLPLSDEAAQFYKTGRPFLQRHLPFWLAVLAQQLLVVLIPVLAVLYPMLKFIPAAYGWAMRRRVYRLYRELKLIEDQAGSPSTRTSSTSDLIARLERLDERTSHFRVPVAFRPLLYALRLHIALVRQRLERG